MLKHKLHIFRTGESFKYTVRRILGLGLVWLLAAECLMPGLSSAYGQEKGAVQGNDITVAQAAYSEGESLRNDQGAGDNAVKLKEPVEFYHQYDSELVMKNTPNPREILVKYKNQSKGAFVKQSVENKLGISGLKSKKKLSDARIELLEVADETDTGRVMEELQSDPDVEIAQPNYTLKALDLPDDDYFNEQWGLKNTGQKILKSETVSYYGTPGMDADVLPAWDITKGDSSVVIGVLDTGVQVNHPDLKENIYVNQGEVPNNGIDDDGNGFVDDVRGWDFYNHDSTVYDGAEYDGHGTHVAGIIAAKADSVGIVGVAPNVKIMPLKFLHTDGEGSTSGVIEAIEYAKRMGVKIINCSFGTEDNDTLLKEAMEDSGILFVCAAGNENKNVAETPVYPACFGLPNILSVAAVDGYGKKCDFSNYGAAIDVAAPGEGILSLWSSDDPYSYNYAYAKGTSMATPFVTGIAALLKSYKPSVTPQEMITAIKSTVKPVNKLSGKVNTGGMADAYKALDYIIPVIPVANAGDNKITFKDFKVQLDGSGSQKGKGNILTYRWSFVSKPWGSSTTLLDFNTATPYFIPDRAGNYVLSLIVNNGIRDSAASQVTVKVKNFTDATDDMDSGLLSTKNNSYLSGYTFSDVVPLTDGWVVLGDISRNKVVFVNALTGEVGKEFFLNGAPYKIDYDFEYNMVIATQSGQNQIAKIDMDNDTITYIPVSGSGVNITAGEKGFAFSIVSAGSSYKLSVIDLEQNIQTSITDEIGFNMTLLAYDKEKNNLITGQSDVYYSILKRYTFNEADVGLRLQQTVDNMGDNGRELVISNDGKHVVFCCSGSTGTLYDLDSTDLSHQYGVWNVGFSPVAAAFSCDNRYIVVSTGYNNQAKVFDVNTHEFVDTFNVSGLYKVFLSRGGRVLYGCSSTNGSDRLFIYASAKTVTTVTVPEFSQPVPVANPGWSVRSMFKGYTVTLDAANSRRGKGMTLAYQWRLVSKPEGSRSSLDSSIGQKAVFVPDVLGEYKIRLKVNNGVQWSEEQEAVVKVKNYADFHDDLDAAFIDSIPVNFLKGYTFYDLIPLVDGWVIIGEVNNKQVLIVNALTGQVGKKYTLKEAPERIDFDFDSNQIIATQAGTKQLAFIDMDSDDITYMDTNQVNTEVEVGDKGIVFAYSGSKDVSGHISVIDIEKRVVIGNGADVSSSGWGWMEYDRKGKRLFLGLKVYNSVLYGYAFDSTTGTLQRSQGGNFGYTARDMQLSQDGKHLAYSCGGGNSDSGGYRIFDIDSTNFAARYGDWSIGAYPQAAAFNYNNRYIIFSNGSQLELFTVDSHESVYTINASNVTKVYFSRGGKIIYAGHGESGEERVTQLNFYGSAVTETKVGRIESFVLLKSENAFLKEDIAGKINEDNTVTVVLPISVSHRPMVPSIRISENATISPSADEAQNFNGPVAYTVTAEDGTQTEYDVEYQDDCFIATAAFGSKFEPAVVLLRKFRDRYLLTNGPGKAFVAFYYKHSPPIARFIAHYGVLKLIVRILLVPFIIIAYLFMHLWLSIPLLVLLLLMLLMLVWKKRYTWSRTN